MATDLGVVEPQELLRVSEIRVVPALAVRTLDIVGEDFQSVDEVLVNDVPSPDVVVLGPTRLLAEVPDAVKGSTVTSVTVLSRRLALSDKSFIRFRVSPTSSKVRGELGLMQKFLKLLFTTPGTDIFAPKLGGAGLRTLGQNFGKEEGADIVSSFIVSVETTKRQMIQLQSRNPSLPPDERLLSASVVQAGFNRNETALVVSVEILSQAGRQAKARLEL
jgi:hypothetical protein